MGTARAQQLSDVEGEARWLNTYNKMTKRKPKSVLDAIKHVDLDIKIPDKTKEIKPLKTHIPGLETEKTEIGVAEVEGKKTVYIKMKLRGGS